MTTDRAPDDTDLGWGEPLTPRQDARVGENDARLLEDRPPHHDGRSSN